MKKAAVIGGGISGLTTAFYLQQAAKNEGIPIEINLFEASERLGGKVHTIHHNDFVIERGADSFLARKQPGMDLIHALGLEDRLYRNEAGKSYVLVNNRLHDIPSGTFMGIPIQEESLQHASILSASGKERALAEVTIPRGSKQQDQSLGTFLRRRFGDELVDHLLAPLLSGIYSSDIDDMSLMASFPEFHELEQTHGSVLAGLRVTMPERRMGTGKKSGQFVSIQNGLSTVIDALANELGSSIHKETDIQKVSQSDSSYILQDKQGNTYEADAVIMAVPHKNVPGMFTEEKALESLRDIPVKSVANVVLAFDQEDIEQAMDGTGFVVSRTSDVRITACTWTHEKWPQTTPEGKALLRAYVGRPTDQDIVQKSDEDITHIVMEDLKKVMDMNAEPEFSVVTRWEKLMPQYTVGHPAIVIEVEQHINENYPGLFLTGASYHGVGLPDCIGHAKQLQETVLTYLRSS